VTTLAQLDAALDHRWFSFRSFELTEPPDATRGLAAWLAALPDPAPLTDDERAWLQANDGATSWSGDDFVRLSRLRARRPLGAEVYQQRKRSRSTPWSTTRCSDPQRQRPKHTCAPRPSRSSSPRLLADLGTDAVVARR